MTVQSSMNQMVEVEAPANLEAGYTFEAVYEGRQFQVKVPEGGVTKGQRFQAPLPPSTSDVTGEEPTKITKALDVPTGNWRDGTFDCFTNGCCNPLLCWSFWFTPVALAQVMTRLKLTWLGQPSDDTKKGTAGAASHEKTFPIVVGTSLAFYLIYIIIGSIPKMAWLVGILAVLWAVYTVGVGMMTRANLRNRYDIPGSAFEDCCCLFWCNCCTVSQMGRHTHDYTAHNGVCCSKTGLKKEDDDSALEIA